MSTDRPLLLSHWHLDDIYLINRASCTPTLDTKCYRSTLKSQVPTLQIVLVSHSISHEDEIV